MKISIEIPENHFAYEKPIYLLTGDGELLAYQEVFISHENGVHLARRGDLMVKSARCIYKEDPGSPRAKEHESCCGDCPHLGANGCLFAERIPFSCARSDCSKHFRFCKEKFKVNGLGD